MSAPPPASDALASLVVTLMPTASRLSVWPRASLTDSAVTTTDSAVTTAAVKITRVRAGVRLNIDREPAARDPSALSSSNRPGRPARLLSQDAEPQQPCQDEVDRHQIVQEP